MPDLKITPSTIKTIAGVVAFCFAVFFFMDERHAHPKSVSESAADLNQRIMMAESTRYAEVAKYYTDKLKDGEQLSQAELSRLDLVQRQQERINATLKGSGK